MKKSLVFCVVLGLCAAFPMGASAGPDPNYTLIQGTGSCPAGDSVAISTSLDFPNGSNVSGVSYGICHDAALLAINCVGGQPNDCTADGIIVQGAAAAATNGGTGASFFAPATTNTPDDGYTCGIVINLLGADSLAPASNAEVAVATYRCLDPGLAPGEEVTTPLTICQTGNPVVLLSVGISGGGDVVPVTTDGSVTIIGPPPPYTLVQGSADPCFEGSSVDIPTTLSFDAAASAASGVSYGVCHDPALVGINCVGGQPNDCTENGIIVQGAAVAATNGGTGASFFAPATTGAGYTLGIVINLLGGDSLANIGDAEIAIATYRCIAEGLSPLTICETGDPVVLLSVGVVGGGDEVPATVDGSINVLGVTQAFTLSVPGKTDLEYDPEKTGTGTVDVAIQLREDEVDPGFPFPTDTQGFSYGLRHSSEVFIGDAGVPPTQDRGIRPAPVMAALNGGAGPEFFGPNADAVGGGHTLGVVYTLLGGTFVQFAAPTDVVVVTYEVDPAFGLGNEDGAVVALDFAPSDDPLGDPAVLPGVVVAGSLDDPILAFENGELNLIAVVDLPFIRGDCNDDGIVNIADGIFTLNSLFQNGPDGGCAEACDTTRDGMFDSSDAIAVFNYQFLDGPAPSAPFPDCGAIKEAPCDEYNSCP